MPTTAQTALAARFEDWRARRECGGCTACCLVHAIVETLSPQYRWCRYCTPGVGCAIYDGRPRECRGYYCGWRLGFGTEEERPDRGGMVLDLQVEDETPILVIWRPLREEPGQLERAWATAHEMRDVLRAAGTAPATIEFRGMPPTKVVRWTQGEEHAGDE